MILPVGVSVRRAETTYVRQAKEEETEEEQGDLAPETESPQRVAKSKVPKPASDTGH